MIIKKQFHNSNNSSEITFDNSNMTSNKRKINNNSISKYLNSSIFESRTSSTERTKHEIYLTEVNNFNSIDTERSNKHIMEEVFDYKPTLTGRILPSIRKKPPTMIYCCKEKYEANNLSKLYDTYWVNPPIKKKIIVNHKNERSRVRDSSNEYIEKTKDIILARYNFEIKKEAVQRIENNIKNEISSLEQTMKQMKRCKDDLENNFITAYNEALKKLDIQISEERIKNDELSIQLAKLVKEVNKIQNQIIKIDGIKKGIEKWIIFQIRMDKRIIPKNLKEILEKVYHNNLIFSSVEQFEDWFESMKIKNIYLLNKFNDKVREKDEIKKSYLQMKKIQEKATWLDNEVNEKEKVLELLKIRYKKLESEKKELTKFKYILNDTKLNKSMYTIGDKPKILKDILFIKTKSIYSQINSLIGNEIKNNILESDIIRINRKEEKIIKMLTSLELILNYLIEKFIDYRMNPKTLRILKEIKNRIDTEHKNNTALLAKIAEEKKIKKLKEKLELRNKRGIFLPLRKVDNYPFAILNKHKISITKDNFHKSNELSFYDFIYENE